MDLVPHAFVTISMCAKNLLGLFLQSTLGISSLFAIVCVDIWLFTFQLCIRLCVLTFPLQLFFIFICSQSIFKLNKVCESYFVEMNVEFCIRSIEIP